MAQKYRAQILLEPQQHRVLQEIAEREGKSISQVARDVIQLGLDALEKNGDILWKQRIQALDKLQSIRTEIREKKGVYQGNLIEEARLERENQLNQARDQGAEK